MWAYWFKVYLKRFVSRGTIKVTLLNGDAFSIGNEPAPSTSIEIRDKRTLRGICLNPNLAVGEAYMNGTLTIENDDLKGFLNFAQANLNSYKSSVRGKVHSTFLGLFRLLYQFNSLVKSQKNVQHHYDLTGELYSVFLDKDKQYSCAYFPEKGVSLEEAQIAKKEHIAKKLLLKPGMQVLDIGSGWGGLGLTLAKEYGAIVKGLTLSTEQHKVSNQRAEEVGLHDNVQFHLMDYRKVTGNFDRVVSVGMFEHVGVPNYRDYFRTVHKSLKDEGVALIHTIGRSTPPGLTNSWLTKYIFPGGYVPSLSETMKAIEKEGLVVNDIEVLRIHYAETLAHWYKRFEENIDKIRKIYDERFCRMWRFYLASCETAFRVGNIVVFQIQLSKKNSVVPITRDYLYN